MRLPRRGLIVLTFLIGLAPFARAEDTSPTSGDSKSSAPTAVSAKALTGKERLGPKWSDEQRIDNCKVPLDKRGTRPRPSACSDAPPS
jgi:hypothetical protein